LKTTASQAILERLAREQRRVLSDWRALILLRRATFELAPRERRWAQLPQQPDDLAPLLRQMQAREEISPIKHHPHLYQVTVPYARASLVEEPEVLLETNPYAVLSHLSALVFHGLTEELPKSITATISADTRGDLLPLGTEPNDWEGIRMPGGRTPKEILGQPVHWTRVKPERFFGFSIYQPHGYLVRVTTPERTLLDGLQDPEFSGGIANVFRAWSLARDTLDIDALLHQVDRFGVAVLRQRVGYIFDEFALSHPVVEAWRDHTSRGGSNRLVGSEPYSPVYSERWNLSLNGPA
jgi:predicted transcriptional regulator of viral defense system